MPTLPPAETAGQRATGQRSVRWARTSWLELLPPTEIMRVRDRSRSRA
jgi:hypothetical protein